MSFFQNLRHLSFAITVKSEKVSFDCSPHMKLVVGPNVGFLNFGNSILVVIRVIRVIRVIKLIKVIKVIKVIMVIMVMMMLMTTMMMLDVNFSLSRCPCVTTMSNGPTIKG